jgi:hypothetical protein
MEGNDSVHHSFFGRFRTKLTLLVLLPVFGALGLAWERNFEHRRAEKERVVHEIKAVSHPGDAERA